MEKSEIIQYILGSTTLEFLISFYIFAVLGVAFSMLLHYKRKVIKDIKKQEYSSFSWKFWLSDNAVRVATSIITIFVVVRFYNELPIDYDLNMFLGLLVGMSLDTVIIFIRNKTSINIFQSK